MKYARSDGRPLSAPLAPAGRDFPDHFGAGAPFWDGLWSRSDGGYFVYRGRASADPERGGSEKGGTAIHALEPPLALRPVLHLELPRTVTSSCRAPSLRTAAHRHLELTRTVTSSGNGALVLRSGCQSGAAGDTPRYCMVTPSGVLRGIRVRGDGGVERVVALHDEHERAAVVIPTRTS